MPTRRAVLAVCGLAGEARIVGGGTVRCVVGGGDAGRLATELERAIGDGVAGVISIGIAGALDAALAPGGVVVARDVAAPTATFATTAPWRDALVAALPGARVATVAGSDTMLVDRAAKAALAEATGAVVVDMESHVAARLASAHGLPFVALRVVVDPLQRPVPHAARVAMRADGGIALGAVVASLARDPRQLAGLARLARDARAALGALGRCRDRLGDRLGLPDLDDFALDVVREDVARGPHAG